MGVNKYNYTKQIKGIYIIYFTKIGRNLRFSVVVFRYDHKIINLPFYRIRLISYRWFCKEKCGSSFIFYTYII